jgi:hypothetical protein
MNIDLQALLAELAQDPQPHEIAQNEGRFFMPISFVESNLDRMFYGMWDTKNIHTMIVANEICVSLELSVYFAPIDKWITKTGTGAAMIQQKKDSVLSDIDSKFKNTLIKDYPHAKAEAVKNAAKSLGRRFGRDLNRKNFDLELKVSGVTGDDKKSMAQQIEACQDLDDLKLLFEGNQNREYLPMFNLRKRAILEASKMLINGK